MVDIFMDPLRRVARAKKHITDLDAGIQDFLSQQPYSRVIETDPNTGYEIHKVKLTAPFPDALLDQAVEIAEGLRAALDKAGYASAVTLGNTRLKGTYFPIADTDPQIDTDIIGRGRCSDLHSDILSLFRSFNPHKAGNPLIWALNQLANGSKHRILIPVGMSVGGGVMPSFSNPGRGYIQMGFPPRWDTENDEMVLVTAEKTVQVQYQMSLEMFVEIRQMDGLGRGPAQAIFSAMAAEVERVVMATKAETARIMGGTC